MALGVRESPGSALPLPAVPGKGPKPLVTAAARLQKGGEWRQRWKGSTK